MSDSKDTVHLKIGFDRELSPRLLDGFVEPLRAEMEFGDLRDERFRKSGWGMGRALVVKVRRSEMPDPSEASPDLYVSMEFRGKLAKGAAEEFVDLVRKELTADGDKKEAWGMGIARVIAVAQLDQEGQD